MFGKLFNKIGKFMFNSDKNSDCCSNTETAVNDNTADNSTINNTDNVSSITEHETDVCETNDDVKLVERTCPECGTKFIVRENFVKTFCSDKCRIKAKSRRMREKNHVERHATCKHCGKDFIQTPKFHRYCSEECKSAYYAEHGMKDVSDIFSNVAQKTPITKHCEHCGKEFTTTRYGNPRIEQRFCSVKCRKQHRNITDCDMKTEIECPQCGKKFVRTSSSQKFCSSDCRDAYRKAHRNLSAELSEGNHEIHANCVLCGTEFVRRMSGAGNYKPRFCSEDHRKVFDRIKQRLVRKNVPHDDASVLKYYNEIYLNETVAETVEDNGKIKYKLVCKVCGNEFLSVNRHAMYCSSDCKKIHDIKARRKNRTNGCCRNEPVRVFTPTEVKCRWCGKTFMAHKSNECFCSDDCLKMARKAKDFSGKKLSLEEFKEHMNNIKWENIVSSRFVDMNTTMITAKCESCGKEFEYKLSGKNFRRYCSHGCKRAAMYKLRRKRNHDFSEGHGDDIRKMQYVRLRLRYIETSRPKNRDGYYQKLIDRFNEKKVIRMVEKSKKNAIKYDNLVKQFKGSPTELKKIWLMNVSNSDACNKINLKNKELKLKEIADKKERKAIEKKEHKAEMAARSAEARRAAYAIWKEKHADEIEAKRQDTLRRKAEKHQKALVRRQKFIEEDTAKRLKIIESLKKKGYKVLYTKCEQCGADIPYIESDDRLPLSSFVGAKFKRFCNKYCINDYVTEHGRLDTKGDKLVTVKTYYRGQHAGQVKIATVKQKNVERYLMGHSWLAERDETDDEENLIKTIADRADMLSENLNAF